MITIQLKTSFLGVVFDGDHDFEGPRASKAHLDTVKYKPTAPPALALPARESVRDGNYVCCTYYPRKILYGERDHSGFPFPGRDPTNQGPDPRAGSQCEGCPRARGRGWNRRASAWQEEILFADTLFSPLSERLCRLLLEGLAGLFIRQ